MKRCLIVDDSRIVRKVIRKIIEPLGFEILEAENGQEALATIHHDGVDFVMLDWNMPVMSGLECLIQVRALKDITQPVIIFCTTENDLAKIQEAVTEGADEYVMKPFDEHIIKGKLEQLGLI